MPHIATESLGRYALMAAGGFLAGAGFRRAGAPGAVLAAAGLGLVLTGLRLGEAAGRRPAPAARAAGPAWPAELRRSLAIARPRREVFAFFREHCGLTTAGPEVERVQLVPDLNFGRWIVRTPAGPLRFEAEITDFRDNERIAWHSVAGSDVAGDGWAEFRDTRDGRGTEVHVYMRWPRPAGLAGRFAAWLAGSEPAERMRRTLREAKTRIESGWHPPLPRPAAEGEASRSG